MLHIFPICMYYKVGCSPWLVRLCVVFLYISCYQPEMATNEFSHLSHGQRRVASSISHVISAPWMGRHLYIICTFCADQGVQVKFPTTKSNVLINCITHANFSSNKMAKLFSMPIAIKMGPKSLSTLLQSLDLIHISYTTRAYQSFLQFACLIVYFLRFPLFISIFSLFSLKICVYMYDKP